MALWEAKAHTVAKIGILRGYLYAWFNAMGRSQSGTPLLYIDGFAGPGRYMNSNEGSPLAAINAAAEVRAISGQSWRAGTIHCVFVESNPETFSELNAITAGLSRPPELEIKLVNDSFESALPELARAYQYAFMGNDPLFVFLDPFGAKGVSFQAVANLLGSPKSEVLINFDADGLVRIVHAGLASNSSAILTQVFGDESWRIALDGVRDFRDECLALVALYKEKLRSLPRVRYVYEFEMLTSHRRTGTVGYFLVFASQHPKGLEKMKEAMRRLDQNGSFQFSNAHANQLSLVRFDQPDQFARQMLRHFSGKGPIPYQIVEDYALNETPFSNPKSMLKLLDMDDLLVVSSSKAIRRKGTFADHTIQAIEFIKGGYLSG